MKPQNDPYNMFGREFQLGTAIYFVEFLVYNFPSEEDDEVQAISNVIAPHGEVGKLRTIWTPLPIGDAEEPEEISDPEELLGKAWKAKVGAWPCMNPPAVSCTRWRLQCHLFPPHEQYTSWNALWPSTAPNRHVVPVSDQIALIVDQLQLVDATCLLSAKIEIKGALDLVQPVKSVYCSYKFFGGVKYTTSKVEAATASQSFTLDYEHVHEVPRIAQTHIDFLSEPFHVAVFVKCDVQPLLAGAEELSTTNPAVVSGLFTTQ